MTAYNHQRPHQALGMATPASRFRPNGPTRSDQPAGADPRSDEDRPFPLAITDSEPAAVSTDAVELDLPIPPRGELNLLQGKTRISVRPLAGRTVTVWVDWRRMHPILDEHFIRSVTVRLTADDLQELRTRGEPTF